MLSLSSDKTKNPKISTRTLKIMYTAEKKKIRRMCTGCYTQIKEAEGRVAAGKKVSTYCSDCEQQPFFCIECFGQHNK
uniref:Unkown protein n=1 Tax=Riptortus pedestris TaxID=329032 RepID=R4WE76_RIPPE|nr:unkown protein [Riptortus pedestris]